MGSFSLLIPLVVGSLLRSSFDREPATGYDWSEVPIRAGAYCVVDLYIAVKISEHSLTINLFLL